MESIFILYKPEPAAQSSEAAEGSCGAMELGSCKILSICPYGTPGMHGCQIKQNTPIQRSYHKQKQSSELNFK